MNEKFFALPVERQEQIINAAYEVFSRNSYKNASMSRLADAGGVSKSLLFHYFLNKKELYLYLWEHAGRLFREAAGKGHTQSTDFFEIICQRVLANCVFMREAPTIYLFALRALFEENPEIKGELRHNYKAAYSQGIDNMLMPMDTDSFRPGIDTRLLLEEINGYLLSCYWQMFSSGELAPDFLEKDILKRTGQWRMVYLKERND
jgi:AcrR family transcriptional regulator